MHIAYLSLWLDTKNINYDVRSNLTSSNLPRPAITKNLQKLRLLIFRVDPIGTFVMEPFLSNCGLRAILLTNNELFLEYFNRMSFKILKTDYNPGHNISATCCVFAKVWFAIVKRDLISITKNFVNELPCK